MRTQPDTVAAILKSADPDRYFASLVVPEPQRPAVQAVFAFSAEIASVRERARQPAAGEIRLQWWDDALAGAGHGEVRKNPVADALLSAIGDHGLPVVPLRRLIAARRFDLYDDPMPDLHTFEGYAGETVSVLYQFAATILNGGAQVEPGDAAGHLGVAHALMGHIAAFGYNARLGRLFLPLDVLIANGVTEAEVFSLAPSEGLFEAFTQLIEVAGGHIETAETAIAALPRPLRPAFAMAPVVRSGLRQIARRGGNPFDAPPQMPDWRKIAAIAMWSWRPR